ncbi:hypothetical protein [Pseudomonas paralcaligenes]|uniref:hypothetical protein n=1 Tax=Pseudomonas paralcaligenes TaxID=2772558 RepID=UPI001C7F8127|nr:hypothetical protein [Pseudomonas paralcaligenes]
MKKAVLLATILGYALLPSTSFAGYSSAMIRMCPGPSEYFPCITQNMMVNINPPPVKIWL